MHTSGIDGGQLDLQASHRLVRRLARKTGERGWRRWHRGPAPWRICHPEGDEDLLILTLDFLSQFPTLHTWDPHLDLCQRGMVEILWYMRCVLFVRAFDERLSPMACWVNLLKKSNSSFTYKGQSRMRIRRMPCVMHTCSRLHTATHPNMLMLQSTY